MCNIDFILFYRIYVYFLYCQQIIIYLLFEASVFLSLLSGVHLIVKSGENIREVRQPIIVSFSF